MDDDLAPPPDPIAQSNLTRAGIIGKVAKRHIGTRKKRKPVKMSSDKRHHVKSLMKRGMISPRAASFNGLKK